MTQMLAEFRVDKLLVKVFPNRVQMGAAAAAAAAADLRKLLSEQEKVVVVFAAAPSQNEFLDALAKEPGIDWQRVVALHMDEYVGLPEGHPQRFSEYLERRIWSKVQPGEVHRIRGDAPNPEEEAQRYAEIVRANRPDVVLMGIGENGHIAFNDPPVADFHDPLLVKVVELDETCRLQQVHDGCFPRLEDVPTHAITLTVPALMSARVLHCVVPGPTKTSAVTRTLKGEISTECPATILRTHDNATLYLDTEAAAGVRDLWEK